MEPIPETAEAVEQYGPFLYEDGDLLEQLVVIGDQVAERVPECVGLSVSLIEHDVTFTLVATDAAVASLDAVQYVDGGPCIDAIQEHHAVAFGVDPLQEDEWQIFASATAARGIASTLSLPIVREGRTIGGFNLYASSQHAFDGKHEPVAGILGAWAGGAITNADLSFGTREMARRAPLLLRESTDQAIAVGLLARSRGIEAEEAEELLRDSAVRAGVSLSRLVGLMIEAFRA
jgi:GAF domain-containing protein